MTSDMLFFAYICTQSRLKRFCIWYERTPNWYGIDYKSVTKSVTMSKNVTKNIELTNKILYYGKYHFAVG